MKSGNLFHTWHALKRNELVSQYVVRADGRFEICPLRMLFGISLTVTNGFMNSGLTSVKLL